MNWKIRTLIVALALAMVSGSASLALAQGPTGADHPTRGGLWGEVTAISDDGFTLQTRRGEEVTVVVTDDTRYRIPGIENPSLADVQVGMLALVRGASGDNGVFVAQWVGAASQRQVRRHTVRGEVTAVAPDSGTLTINTRRGEWTIHTTEETRYRISGVEDPSLADVQVGDQVLVIGQYQKDTPPGEGGENVGTARLIAVAPKGLVKGHGRVTTIEGNTLIVDTRRGAYTVVTDEATRYRARDIEEPSLDDIHEGDAILVIGVKQDDGTILAKGIGIMGQREGNAHPVRPDGVTVTPRQGPLDSPLPPSGP